MKITNEFVQEYNALIYAFVKKYTKDYQEIPDIMQDVYLRLLENNTFDETRGSLGAWLGTVTRNVVYKHYNKTPVTEELPYDVQQNEDFMKEIEADLDDALKNLPPVKAEVFKLKYFHGYSHIEIGALVGISVTASQTLAQRAAQELVRETNIR